MNTNYEVVMILDILVGKHSDAVSVTKKASASYQSLPESSKEALKETSANDRQRMTRNEMKQRAAKIGQRIKQLVINTSNLHSGCWVSTTPSSCRCWVSHYSI